MALHRQSIHLPHISQQLRRQYIRRGADSNAPSVPQYADIISVSQCQIDIVHHNDDAYTMFQGPIANDTQNSVLMLQIQGSYGLIQKQPFV